MHRLPKLCRQMLTQLLQALLALDWFDHRVVGSEQLLRICVPLQNGSAFEHCILLSEVFWDYVLLYFILFDCGPVVTLDHLLLLALPCLGPTTRFKYVHCLLHCSLLRSIIFLRLHLQISTGYLRQWQLSLTALLCHHLLVQKYVHSLTTLF